MMSDSFAESLHEQPFKPKATSTSVKTGIILCCYTVNVVFSTAAKGSSSLIDNQFDSVPTDGSKSLRDASIPRSSASQFKSQFQTDNAILKNPESLESIRHSHSYKVSMEYFLWRSVPGGFVRLLVLFSRSKEHETIREWHASRGKHGCFWDLCVNTHIWKGVQLSMAMMPPCNPLVPLQSAELYHRAASVICLLAALPGLKPHTEDPSPRVISCRRRAPLWSVTSVCVAHLPCWPPAYAAACTLGIHLDVVGEARPFAFRCWFFLCRPSHYSTEFATRLYFFLKNFQFIQGKLIFIYLFICF